MAIQKVNVQWLESVVDQKTGFRIRLSEKMLLGDEVGDEEVEAEIEKVDEETLDSMFDELVEGHEYERGE